MPQPEAPIEKFLRNAIGAWLQKRGVASLSEQLAWLDAPGDVARRVGPTGAAVFRELVTRADRGETRLFRTDLPGSNKAAIAEAFMQLRAVGRLTWTDTTPFGLILTEAPTDEPVSPSVMAQPESVQAEIGQPAQLVTPAAPTVPAAALAPPNPAGLAVSDDLRLVVRTYEALIGRCDRQAWLDRFNGWLDELPAADIVSAIRRAAEGARRGFPQVSMNVQQRLNAKYRSAARGGSGGWRNATDQLSGGMEGVPNAGAYVPIAADTVKAWIAAHRGMYAENVEPPPPSQPAATPQAEVAVTSRGLANAGRPASVPGTTVAPLLPAAEVRRWLAAHPGEYDGRK